MAAASPIPLALDLLDRHPPRTVSRRRAQLWRGVFCLALLGAGLPQSWAQGGGKRLAAGQQAAAQPRVTRDTVAGGQHWRIASAHGPIHVWTPPGYNRARAGIVLYVHGYHIGADSAWQTFQLAEQFHASRQNALFIVPEAPRSPAEEVHWPALGRLLLEVGRRTNLPLPRGHIVALAHSGGYRTAAAWLSYRWLDHLVLLDALYANEAEFQHWIDQDERQLQHKLILVGADTRAACASFARRVPYAVKLRPIPDYESLQRRARRTRLLFFDSQFSHNELVRNGKVIPLTLRLTRLQLL